MEFGQHADVLPTTLGILGVRDLGQFEGIDLSTHKRDAAYFCRVREGLAEGSYKYVRNQVSGQEELYDLEADPQEEKNLIQAEPEKAAAMRDKYGEFTENISRDWWV